MSDNKKYYYLKLKDNFFETEEMILLQNEIDGYLYSDILMKLYLRSLKNDGKLMFNDFTPYNSKLLAQIVRHQVETVEKALKIFNNLGLIEKLDNGAIYMTQIQNFIGKSSTEGERKKEYRARIKKEKEKLLGEGQNNGQMSNQMSDECPPEIETETKLESELNKETELEEKINTKTVSSASDNSFLDIITQFAKSREPNDFEKEELKRLSNMYGCETVFEAITIAQKANALSIRYIEGILKTPDKNEQKKEEKETKKEKRLENEQLIKEIEEREKEKTEAKFSSITEDVKKQISDTPINKMFMEAMNRKQKNEEIEEDEYEC